MADVDADPSYVDIGHAKQGYRASQLDMELFQLFHIAPLASASVEISVATTLGRLMHAVCRPKECYSSLLTLLMILML